MSPTILFTTFADQFFYPKVLMRIIALWGICIGFAGCNIINPDEPVPAYIAMDSITIATDYNSQGTASSEISDAWVYLNNQPEGAFPLPTTIPVITDGGTQNITIAPGVRSDGFENIRAIIGLFNFLDTNVVLKQGQVTRLNPVLKYRDACKFKYIEDFDDGGIEFIRTNASDTFFLSTGVAPFEGPYSAIVYLDKTRQTLQSVSKDAYSLQRNRLTVVEINYKCTTSFNIGLQKVKAGGVTTNIPYLTVYPTTQWKKIYIDVSPIVNALENFDALNYKLLFTALLDSDKTSGQFMIDNVKLVSVE